MSKIEIEKGIPLPRNRSGCGKTCGPVSTAFIFEMEEGNSIVLPLKNANSLRVFIHRNFKEWKAVWRKLPDGNYRVWKVRRDNNENN
jgi:hypothetical protein